MKVLLERQDVDPNRPDKYDQTPLLFAALNGYEGVVKLLLERADVDPNCPDGDGQTPLVNAAIKGCKGVVKLLLERRDVDPNCPDKNDRTALVWAANVIYGDVALCRDVAHHDNHRNIKCKF